MSKRIKQQFNNGRIRTFTTGNPRGNLPNFDVSVSSPAFGQHRPTKTTIDFVDDNGVTRNISFNGRQTRSLYEIFSRHFDQID